MLSVLLGWLRTSKGDSFGHYMTSTAIYPAIPPANPGTQVEGHNDAFLLKAGLRGPVCLELALKKS